MRGVYLPPGSHTVEFKFQPPIRLFYVSVLAVITTLILFGRFVYVEIKSRPKAPAPAPITPALPLQKKSDKSARKKTQRK
jgi:hypothetical protein